MARYFLKLWATQQRRRGVALCVLLCALVLLVVSGPLFPLRAQGGVLALAGGRGATLYDRPGGTPLLDLAPGERLTAQGRTADAAWITGVTADGTTGWVETRAVILPDPLVLPVVDETAGPGEPASPVPVEAQGTATPSRPTVTPTATPTPLPPTATSTPTTVPSPTATPSPTPAVGSRVSANVIAIVRRDGVPLLDGPGGEALSSLTRGAVLKGMGRTADNRWLLVRTADGVLGWLAADAATAFGVDDLPILGSNAAGAAATPATDVAAGAEVVTGGSRLNVRAGPGTDFPVIAKALNGERVSVLARNEAGTWLQIALDDGEFGWVATEFTRLDAALDALPISGRTRAAGPLLAAPTPGAPAVAPAARNDPAAASPAPGVGGTLAIQTDIGGAIYLYTLETGELRPLTAGLDPALSPDGSQMAFVRGGGENGVYVIDVDGGQERRIYSGGEGLRAPAWSPDGQFIVFSRVTGASQCRDVGFGFCFPDVPPLGDFPLVSRAQRGLSRVDVNGENYRDLPTNETATAPDWIDAGIVYQSNDGLQITEDDPEKYEGDDARANRAVTADYLHRDPDWQPGGGRIVFVVADTKHQEIYAVNPDGSGVTAYTRPSSGLLETFPHNVAPVWSPDGEHIAFLSNRDGDWAVYVMAADGSAQQRLPIELAITYRFQDEQALSWGP